MEADSLWAFYARGITCDMKFNKTLISCHYLYRKNKKRNFFNITVYF
ncbi:hypothetical protein XSR1_30123 [Xenorhabdus szentirmaii DSM 16338]|uniref:Uncharacterized protein n=1 Tax=Xenorhabdus szentirmaii DSM 16338 TaxID=1427518 RepID=W1IXT5_9GAMM|nr:hypothetical protein XSR1_30123 [Xenorhabdus szentirmaii DSM 16338]